MVLWKPIHYIIHLKNKCVVIQPFCKWYHLSTHLFVGNHQQQGSLRLLGGKQTNYKEVCAQQTMKMPYHIMQTEVTNIVLPKWTTSFEGTNGCNITAVLQYLWHKSCLRIKSIKLICECSFSFLPPRPSQLCSAIMPSSIHMKFN